MTGLNLANNVRLLILVKFSARTSVLPSASAMVKTKGITTKTNGQR